ncbi:uncharacterized protein P174DRAFT_452184 [Aspergillus novofumigatus IBT 16806]|uniref:Helix-turn-helix domain-containing protein n=1 Tax=Aspergillus novofumigatus (strain IBT 16806) TaxID=1392255 RepID=A0A2I1C5N6_ASPN1|nr:uncharacterized protein P174DRAFT_452184 [Aspergillus novofumigatus IBT 16806]PKX92922.1 hypothetical protein P174DRAFT_452184 [Aspergillus novofumigatus IBT 16806]
MGSSASKPARSAASAVSRRQYPKQPSAASRTAPQVPPREPNLSQPLQAQSQAPSLPKEQASTTKSAVIDLDGRDPDFAASLRSIGPSPPTLPSRPVFPTAANPALLVLTARQTAAKAAQEEAEQIGRPGFAGREFVDAWTIRQALTMRDRQGLSLGEIEGMLKLKKGVLGRLGAKGVVGEVG